MSQPPTVLVAGNPNSGKTTLFNLLTGSRGKVGNYPGVTVDRRSALGPLPSGNLVGFVDVPGSYSLTARSADESVAVEALLDASEHAPDAVLLVADATTLRRGLYFATQVIETGLPTVLVLTMADEAKKRSLEIDREALEQELGCNVVLVVARTGEGKDALLRALERTLNEKRPAKRIVTYDDRSRIAIEQVAAASTEATEEKRHVRALWALLSLGNDELGDDRFPRLREQAKLAHADCPELDLALVAARYRAIDSLLDRTSREPGAKERSFSARLDDVLVHPVFGLLVFLLVMATVFQALFSWSEPFVGLLEDAVGFAKTSVASSLPPGAFTSLLTEGVISGVGNVIVFVPQIALLFVFLTVMEDSGYLARVAFVIDRVMGGVGLHGRAFVPMLSGFACAIPAVMATRTIESKKDRLLTMLVIPLMSCSARLPVYVLITATVFNPKATILGPLSLGAFVLLCMYLLSVIFAIGSAFVLRRTVLKGDRPTLVLELPPYRRPTLRNVLWATWGRVRRFLSDAGTVILAMTIILWGLLNYPKDEAKQQAFAEERAVAMQLEDEGARQARLTEIDTNESGTVLRESVAGRLGHGIEPAIAPLGMDWRLGIGVLGAFAAREVFVSTLGIVFDVGGDATEESESLRSSLRQAKRGDGSLLMTPLAGVALMVFFVLACQCMSTLAVVKRESGSWKWTGFLFTYMSVLAYVVTLLVYQGGKALGLG